MDLFQYSLLTRAHLIYGYISGILVIFAFTGAFYARKIYEPLHKQRHGEHGSRGHPVEPAEKDTAATRLEAVEPLEHFKWNETRPLQLRPYKPRTHLTMAVETSNVSELIEMDWNYLERIQLRRQIMTEHKDIVLASDIRAKSAVDEFYSWMFEQYLPIRFPQMFRVQQNFENTRGPHEVQNLVTSELISLQPPECPTEALRVLGSHVDDDFLFLLPSSDGDGYQLEAFVTCFPNGFDTSKKLHMKLREIHVPVPGYKEKLEKSMDRFFDRLKVGKFVKRANWTITTTDTPFTPSGIHLYSGDEVQHEDVDISKTNMRVERQVVHRLPGTGALVFSFKTYLYPLTSLKEEGAGEDLAIAIDGLRQGNVPDFHFYKRAAVWGEAVKKFLRS